MLCAFVSTALGLVNGLACFVQANVYRKGDPIALSTRSVIPLWTFGFYHLNGQC